MRLSEHKAPIIELLFSYGSATNGSTNETKIISLYPYSNRELGIFFIYGDDHRLEFGPPPLTEIVRDYWYIPVFLTLSTAIIYLIRRRFKMENANISSAILDMITIFFGGGNIEIRHIIERRFIPVLLFGLFFLQSIWVGDFLSQMSDWKEHRIKTFQQLSTLKIPIYFDQNYVDDPELTIQCLKYILFKLFVMQ